MAKIADTTRRTGRWRNAARADTLKEFAMRKTCSIRLLFVGVILTAALSLCIGFWMGTAKNWKAYEQRIALLEQNIERLLSKQRQAEAEKEKENAAESLNVIEPYAYVLLAEDGFVAVYQADRETLYATTGILVDNLPANLQQEIRDGKIIDSEEQLYSFLENYSS